MADSRLAEWLAEWLESGALSVPDALDAISGEVRRLVKVAAADRWDDGYDELQALAGLLDKASQAARTVAGINQGEGGK